MVVPFSFPENSLNIYNSHWDNFAGVIEKGQVYIYDNKNFDKDLHFKVLQVLDKNKILAIRNRANGYVTPESDYDLICSQEIFLIISDDQYADGANLRNGEYICTGTYSYTTKTDSVKTIYVLTKKSYFDLIDSQE